MHILHDINVYQAFKQTVFLIAELKNYIIHHFIQNFLTEYFIEIYTNI